MTKFVKLIDEKTIEYAPNCTETVSNYNAESNAEMLLADGYKPLILAEMPTNDRMFDLIYEESSENITQVINYLESEEEYNQRKSNEELQLQIDSLNSQINSLDLKRIRAVCEPEIKDEETGETWLDYYNSQVIDLREQIQQLRERITPNDIIE